MTEFKHRLAFIVPTRNRPGLLKNLLASIKAQTVQPVQVIIVDGSDEPIEPSIREYLSATVTCIRVFPPGLTKQRNAGITALGENITLAGFVDDDIVLEPDAVEALLRFWEHCPEDVGGTSFHITNTESAHPVVRFLAKLLGSLFRYDSFKQGAVLRSGFQTMVWPVREDTYAQWLCGGATIWRKAVLQEFKFDEELGGSSYVEDLDFSYSVARKHRLAVLKDSRVQHYPPPFDRRRCYALGRFNIQQRYYFVRKHPELSVLLFYWATVGESLTHLLGVIPRRSLKEAFIAFGNLAGLWDTIRGRAGEVKGGFRKENQS